MILALLDHSHPCHHPDTEPRTRPVVLGQGTRSSLDAALPAVVMLAASGGPARCFVGVPAPSFAPAWSVGTRSSLPRQGKAGISRLGDRRTAVRTSTIQGIRNKIYSSSEPDDSAGARRSCP